MSNVKGVGAVILNNNNEILLTYRKPECKYYNDCWFLPCGTVEENELPEKALIRELSEELGIDVVVEGLLYRNINSENYSENIYTCKITAGIPENHDIEEIDRIDWFHIDALPSNTHKIVLNSVQRYKAENYLQEVIFTELEKGRPGWDVSHTREVVTYIKEIIDNEPDFELDIDVLVIAAYAHDWGYAELYKDGKAIEYDDIQSKKKMHASIGAGKTEILLRAGVFDYLSEDQKLRIIHLVKVHDDLQSLTEFDELVLMEADTLGAAIINTKEYNSDKDFMNRWLKKTKEQRASRFVTDYGKCEVGRIINKLESMYSEL